MYASIRFGIAASALTALLMVGGCKAGDKGQGALKSGDGVALNLSRANADMFAKHFAVGECEADEMEALGALAGLGLGESGAGGLVYGSRSFEGGLVTYSDVKITDAEDDAKVFAADTAVFHCPQMTDDGERFARLDLSDVSVRDAETQFTFETLNVARPSSAAAKAVVRGMTAPGSNMRLGGNVDFGGISLTKMTMTSEEATVKLDTLAWGTDADTELTDVLMDDLRVNFEMKDRETEEVRPVEVAFEGMSARNVASQQKGGIGGFGMMSQAMSQLTVLQKPYDEIVVDALRIKSEMFNLDFAGMKGRAEEKGDIITIRQTLEPMTMTFDDSLSNYPEFGSIYKQIQTLGFETIKLSGSSTTMLDKAKDTVDVKDGLFVLDDGFRLNFEYKAEGVQAMADAAAAAQTQYQADFKAAMAKLETDPEAEIDFPSPPDQMTAMAALKLHNMRMTLEDNSIVERGLRLASEMTGQSEKNLKRSLGLAVMAAALAGENDLQSEVYSEGASAFADFVKKGGTLTIEANPPQPFPMGPLVTGGGENVDPDTLGFSASQSD